MPNSDPQQKDALSHHRISASRPRTNLTLRDRLLEHLSTRRREGERRGSSDPLRSRLRLSKTEITTVALPRSAQIKANEGSVLAAFGVVTLRPTVTTLERWKGIPPTSP